MNATPAALCLGPVDAFYGQPMLQTEHWASRAPLQAMLFEDKWGEPFKLPLGPAPGAASDV